MPTSVTGISTETVVTCRDSAPKGFHGFTLIEIMVVITLIGIVISMTLISANLLRDDREVEKQVLRLSSIIQAVSEEAQMQGRDFGIELMLAGYRFVEYDPIFDVWVQIKDDDLLRQRELTEGMEFELVIEGRRVPLDVGMKKLESGEDRDGDGERDGERDLTDDYLPHILMMSSGNITPFQLALVRVKDDKRVGLEMKYAGKLEVIRDDED